MTATRFMGDRRRTWEAFSQFLMREAAATGYGRQALRRRWTNLRVLAAQCSADITDAEITELLGKPREALDPEANDLKALIAYCVGRGMASGAQLTNALQADLAAEPMAFLAQHSGKAFGETWGPSIARFWLAEEGDQWRKMGAKAFYDVHWGPHEFPQGIRIELKASSEAPAFRFQQVRHPRLRGAESEYDILLCLGVTASSLEWWVIPARELDYISDNGTSLAERTVIVKHHGKKAIIWNSDVGYESEGWFSTDERCRDILCGYHVESEALRGSVIDACSYQRG